MTNAARGFVNFSRFLFFWASVFFAIPLLAQAPAVTLIRDTVYKSDGSLASGSVVITWPSFISADRKPVFGGSKTISLNNGALSVSLVPTSGATPSGVSYDVKYFQSGGVSYQETWVVPSSSDPVSLSQVRTAAAPSSNTQVNASQVAGTAVVEFPTVTQTIVSPATAGVVPLRLKGNSTANANLLEIYDSQATPQLQGRFDPSGALVLSKAPTLSSLTQGSVLYSGSAGLLSEDNTNFFWDGTAKSLHVGPRSGLDSIIGSYIGIGVHNFASLNPSSSGTNSQNILQSVVQDNGTNPIVAVNGVAERTYAGAGSTSGATGVEGDVFAEGTGNVAGITGLSSYTEVDSGAVETAVGLNEQGIHVYGGSVTDSIGTFVRSNSNAGGSITNNYGLKIENQAGIGTNNWAIKTGTGQVEFGDRVLARNINSTRFADQFAGANPGAQIDAAIADAGTAPAVVVAPSSMDGGAPASIPNNVLLVDHRQKSDVLSASPSNLDRVAHTLLQSQLGEFDTRNLSGTVSLTNGSTAVTGSGTAFLAELGNGHFGAVLRLATDAPACWAKILSVSDDTHATLTSNYSCTGGSGIAVAPLTHFPLVIRQTATGGTPNTEEVGESVGLTVICDRTGGSRSLFCSNNNISFNSKSRQANVQENDVSNKSGSDWSEGGETINGELNHNTALLLNSSGTNRAEAGLFVFSTAGSEFQRGVSMDRSWHSKGIYSHAENSAGVHLYLVPAADNSSPAIQLRNASDATTTASINNDGGAFFGQSVGIGLAAPLELLHVKDPTGTASARIAIQSGNGREWAIVSGNAAASSRFDIRDMSIAANRLSIDANGNVGVSTANPATTLDVSGAIRSTLTTVAYSATPTFDASLGNSFKLTLTGNVTGSTISNGHAGETIIFLLCQDGTGAKSMTWPANMKLAGGAFKITVAPNKCDTLTALSDGSNWYELSRSTNQ